MAALINITYVKSDKYGFYIERMEIVGQGISCRKCKFYSTNL